MKKHRYPLFPIRWSGCFLVGAAGIPRLGRPPCSHLGVGPPARRPVSAQDVLLVGGRHLHQVLKKSRGFTLLLFEGGGGRWEAWRTAAWRSESESNPVVVGMGM